MSRVWALCGLKPALTLQSVAKKSTLKEMRSHTHLLLKCTWKWNCPKKKKKNFQRFIFQVLKVETSEWSSLFSLCQVQHTLAQHTHTDTSVVATEARKLMHTLALHPILAHFLTDPIYLCNSSENKPTGSLSLMAAFPPVPLKDKRGCQQSACLDRRSKHKTNAFWTESASLCYRFSKNICFTRQWAGHR